MTALEKARVAVFVCSSHSDRSSFVADEITASRNMEKDLIPVKVEPFEPVDQLRFLMRTKQWFDASDPAQFDERMKVLSTLVLGMLGKKAPAAPAPQAATPLVGPALLPPVSNPGIRLPAQGRRSPFLRLVAIGLVVAAAVLLGGFAWLGLVWLPARVDDALAKGQRQGMYEETYSRACAWQASLRLWDKSVPTYWRLLAFQAKLDEGGTKRLDDRMKAEMRVEYKDALRRGTHGRRADSILYQYAHFIRQNDGNVVEFVAILSRLQELYPDSSYREGTAYYLARYAAERGDRAALEEQLIRLRAMPLNAVLWNFEKKAMMRVREALALLQDQGIGHSEAPASARSTAP